MNRFLQPEWLDELPATDEQARHSRRDLQRLNWCMRHAQIASGVLRSFDLNRKAPLLTDLGGGDGCFLLSVARTLGSNWRGTRAVVVDRQRMIAPSTLAGFRDLGWEVEAVSRDVFDWCEEDAKEASSIVLTNLFLHHFDKEQLKQLLRGVSRRSSGFVALEPRRTAWCVFFSKLVWMIGCNAVTRHDALVSVRAGFRGRE
ncbi:MAG TPA: class I SAM-dependent methyltransferase, partial [Patescibacteria group bacterium]|nr:class I SAM-dependent methyltransferase [Patescibacteria group bacterium]